MSDSKELKARKQQLYDKKIEAYKREHNLTDDADDEQDTKSTAPPVKKKFPTALLCASNHQERADASLILTRAGFVVEECSEHRGVMSRWGYPRNQDVVFLSSTMGDYNGVYFGQEIRRLEKDVHLQAKAKQKHRVREGRYNKGRNPVNGDPLPENYDPHNKAQTKIVLVQAQAKIERTVLIGLFHNKLEKDTMERSGVFDHLLHLPLNPHVHFLQDMFVSFESVKRVEHMPTYTELVAMLTHKNNHRNVEGFGSANPDRVAGAAAALRRAEHAQLRQSVSPSMVLQLEEKIRTLEDQLERTGVVVDEAEKETDVANKNAQELRKKLDETEEERDGLLRNVESLTHLMEMKEEEVVAQRKDFEVYMKAVEASGGLVPTATAEGGSSNTSNRLAGVHSGSTSRSASIAGLVSTLPQADMHRLVHENQQLRESLFMLQSEVHVAKTEQAAVHAKYIKVKDKYAEELGKTAELQGKLDQLQLANSVLATSQRSPTKGGDGLEASVVTARERRRSTLLGIRQLSPSPDLGASNSSILESPSSATGTGVIPSAYTSIAGSPTNAGGLMSLSPRGSIVSQVGFAPTNGAGVPPRPPAQSRGAQRLRKSIIKVKEIIKAKHVFDEKLSNSPKRGSGKGTKNGRGGVFSTAVLESYERSMMELHDDLSRVNVRHNYFISSLQKVPNNPSINTEQYMKNAVKSANPNNKFFGGATSVSSGSAGGTGNTTSGWNPAYTAGDPFATKANTSSLSVANTSTSRRRASSIAFTDGDESTIHGGNADSKKKKAYTSTSAEPQQKLDPLLNDGHRIVSLTGNVTWTFVGGASNTALARPVFNQPVDVEYEQMIDEWDLMERSINELMQATKHFAMEKVTSGAQSLGKQQELARKSSVAHMSNQLRVLLTNRGLGAAQQRDVEKLYEGIFLPFKSFLEEMLSQYRSVITDSVVESMKLFVNEAKLVSQQVYLSTDELDAVLTGVYPDRSNIAPATVPRPPSGNSARQPGVAATPKLPRQLSSGDDDSEISSSTLQLIGEQSSNKSLGKSMSGGNASPAHTYASSAASPSPRKGGDQQHSAEQSSSLLRMHSGNPVFDPLPSAAGFDRALDIPMSHREMLTERERVAKQQQEHIALLKKMQVDARHKFVNHLARQYHHVLRKMLESALQVHTRNTNNFYTIVQRSMDALNEVVIPLQHRVKEAEESGVIRVKHDFATQTDVVVARRKSTFTTKSPPSPPKLNSPEMGGASRRASLSPGSPMASGGKRRVSMTPNSSPRAAPK